MLNRANILKGYKLKSLDDEIGRLKEFYFDDKHWTIRYLVADTGNWLSDKLVLISPHALATLTKEQQKIEFNLTKKQIEDSPFLDSDRNISRQFEELYYEYYGWPMYWDGPYIWGPYPRIIHYREKWCIYTQEMKECNSQLRTTNDVLGHHIHSEDIRIGNIEDFIIDDETWAIHYLIIDAQNLLPGKKFIVSPKWIEHINYKESKVFIHLPQKTIKQLPEYSHESLLSDNFSSIY